MSSNEYIIVGVKKGKTVFNADVSIINQTLDNKIIESTIVADKVSTIIYSKIRESLLKDESNDVTAEDHLATIENLVKETLENSKKEAIKKTLAIYKDNKDGIKYLQACVPNYIQNPLKVGNRLHPTEKPVPLLQYLVALYSNPEEVILDCFSGSGSTGEAALSLQRNVILIEREQEFYVKMKNRLKDKASTMKEFTIDNKK